jgi:uncharacterized membrane protein YphA (DoxX/SURF4 family)
MSKKSTNIIFWIFTILLAAFMGIGAIPDIMNHPDAIDLITKKLGYPPYFLQLIGVAKLLGAIAILVPGFPRIKEWAYAGFFFDLAAALISMIAIGASVSEWAPMFIFFGIWAMSYFYHHKRLKESGKPSFATA